MAVLQIRSDDASFDVVQECDDVAEAMLVLAELMPSQHMRIRGATSEDKEFDALRCTLEFIDERNCAVARIMWAQ